MSTWKRDFASGLIVIVPLIVLVLVVNWIYQHVTRIPLIGSLEPGWMVDPLLPFYRVLIAIAVFTSLVLAVGYFMRTAFGRVAEAQLDDFINRIPALRVVYNASKLAVETALSGTDDLQSPVHIETWAGIRMTAFKTGKKTRDGKLVLFMPTAPNITSGFVIEVESERVTETGETAEEALTRILSAGFAESAHQIPVEEQDVSDVVSGSGGERHRDPTEQPTRTDGSTPNVRDGGTTESQSGSRSGTNAEGGTNAGGGTNAEGGSNAGGRSNAGGGTNAEGGSNAK